MTRIIHTLALAAALASPVTAFADMPRSHSPARQMLQQMIVIPDTTRDTVRHHRHEIRPRVRTDLRDLAGDWTPSAVINRRGRMITLYARYDSWVSIRPNGSLSFSIGCNRYWAQIEPRRHGRIDIGPVAGTRMACPRRETRIERRMVEALRDAERVRETHGGLRLTDRYGTTLLELRGRPHRFSFRHIR